MRGEGKHVVLNSDSSQKLSMFRIVERKVIMNIKTTYTPDWLRILRNMRSLSRESYWQHSLTHSFIHSPIYSFINKRAVVVITMRSIKKHTFLSHTSAIIMAKLKSNLRGGKKEFSLNLRLGQEGRTSCWGSCFLKKRKRQRSACGNQRVIPSVTPCDCMQWGEVVG